ncbi:MAG TPA: PP2C family serine/threonine-protein phosphatase [Chthonomonadaceae bacterium]|nr:PP2C family serine/threonine-protein phosphatase [Chthonomonadaceae bacterium]
MEAPDNEASSTARTGSARRPRAARTPAGLRNSTPAQSLGAAPAKAPSAPPEAAGSAPRWKVASVSVRGTSHERAGGVCQDSHCVRETAPDRLIAAIADGAGSAARSEIGAEIAARTAVDALCELLADGGAPPNTDEAWAIALRAAMDRARAAVECEAERLGLTPRELASTLILLFATPALAAAAQIGDGAAVIADADGELAILTVPQSGEYLNETTFLVTPGAVEAAQTAVWRGPMRFAAAFSDGLQILALRLSDHSPHPPFFAPLMQFIAAERDMEEAQAKLASFLVSPRITERADDDLTLLLAQWAG